MAGAAPIRLIVGLGNPGNEYRSTRHNTGWHLADRMAARAGAAFRCEAKFFGETARISTKDGDIWLLKPTTYMNASGRAVQAMASYFKIAPEEILVAHDELDLVPGCMRLKLGGGNAGHNGLKDITAQLGTPQFWRLRIGIGHPRQFCPQQPVYDWVLSNPSPEHRAAIDTCLDAAEKLAAALAGGRMENVQRSIRKFASPPKPEKAEESEGATSQKKAASDAAPAAAQAPAPAKPATGALPVSRIEEALRSLLSRNG